MATPVCQTPVDEITDEVLTRSLRSHVCPACKSLKRAWAPLCLGWIERTGERRNKPVSNCPADVWRARAVVPVAQDLVRDLGYPDLLIIEGEPYDRQDLLESEGLPGIPYARRTDMGGLRLIVRVSLIECPRCGRPMKQAYLEKGYVCGNAGCRRWRPRLVNETGRSPMVALVMED